MKDLLILFQLINMMLILKNMIPPKKEEHLHGNFYKMIHINIFF